MEFGIWIMKQVKYYLNKNFRSLIKLENKLLSLIQALKIKLSEELQDYKVKTVLETKRLQDYICLKGRVTGLQKGKDYKSLSEGEGESYLLSGVGT